MEGTVYRSLGKTQAAAFSDPVKELVRHSSIRFPGEKPGPIVPPHEWFIDW
jgi:hypothetical protein